jgi:mRNA interferase MazF
LQQPVQRGEVYLAELKPVRGSEQDGCRPVLIVSRDAINRYSSIVIAVPFTDKKNKSKTYPSHVSFARDQGGLTMDSIALCEQVRAISLDRLVKKLGQIDRASMANIEAALKISLDLS